MKRKHAITSAVVVLVLAVLVYFQVRHWQAFDWKEFVRQTAGVSKLQIAIAVALIYGVYVLRAVRWAIFLKPVRQVPVTRLIIPQFIGFTGLALLGRPGELVRPVLIAKKEDLSVASQLAVWTVERVFDIAAVALLLGLTLAIRGRKYEAYPEVARAGIALLGITGVLVVVVILLWWRAEAFANMIERLLNPYSKRIANAVCNRVTAFGQGLKTIHGVGSFMAILLLSIAIWLMIAQSYIQVLHAYPQAQTQVQNSQTGMVETRIVRLHEMKLEDVLLVMGASMVGSVIQLPGVGGGSQLAVISLLSSNIFRGEPYNISRELAVSAGMMLWLVTFMSVIPAGLFLAHRQHISLREVSEEPVPSEP
jgi:uncharacterized protein (TIRG00374 family)